MARLVREFDWADTPLGSPETWPPELKTVVGFVLETHFPKAVVWGPDLVTIYNDAFLPILGDKPEALGRSFAQVWAEVWDQIGPIAQRALAGEATFIEDFPLVIDRSGRPEQAWFTFCYSPLRLADGTVAGMMDTVIETTATVRVRAELDLLTQELGHRLKNVLAMVQAMAAQSLKDVAERDAVEAFTDRVVALGRAHDALLAQSWSAADLRRVAEATLSPLDGLNQVRLQGPDIQIGPSATMTLSLIVYELATNAAKYGALSVPEGRVDLSWRLAGEMLRIYWRESGGPTVPPQSRTGFGCRLIDMGFGAGSAVDRRYRPEGFEADLEAPMRNLQDH
ncbi:sensor histidine kinase [Phenylobacterium sp. Root700]|uniref:sensor histidine kinase n=1 Tax=Phenylobacterium sp. Root700 TaxID=1736591 RepID=UPI000AF607B7|nr:PAS domain-containing sensor histidine kinase [Phenylobacterium sp. Root700]